MDYVGGQVVGDSPRRVVDDEDTQVGGALKVRAVDVAPAARFIYGRVPQTLQQFSPAAEQLSPTSASSMLTRMWRGQFGVHVGDVDLVILRVIQGPRGRILDVRVAVHDDFTRDGVNDTGAR